MPMLCSALWPIGDHSSKYFSTSARRHEDVTLKCSGVAEVKAQWQDNLADESQELRYGRRG